MERDLPLDTTPGQVKGVQGLLDGALRLNSPAKRLTHLTCPPLCPGSNPLRSLRFGAPGHPGHLYAREG